MPRVDEETKEMERPPGHRGAYRVSPDQREGDGGETLS